MAGEVKEDRSVIIRSLQHIIAELVDDFELASGLDEDILLEQVGMDSFVMINLIEQIERRYHISFHGEELQIDRLGTLGGMADSVCAKRLAGKV
ncbi:phosphopantetheine-binding protein [Paenibacillus sp. HB172176]|uniref:phosphopantetheine-binding protein n=1 Tax=Paenibacillus sp. HB172176 TaxID=2493690 RepID=UPI001438D217|nr:phosphopantetheine-binding protein [Paenibacillus sp. HB172176]